jgi:hypothetical protein
MTPSDQVYLEAFGQIAVAPSLATALSSEWTWH